MTGCEKYGLHCTPHDELHELSLAWLYHGHYTARAAVLVQSTTDVVGLNPGMGENEAQQ